MSSAGVTRTYVEMRTPPASPPGAVPADVLVLPVSRCPAVYYRFLYGEVGRDWQWFDRLHWSDAELSAYLARPTVHLHVVHVDGAPAGYAEFVEHDDGSVEIAYFGLMSHALGRGLGRWFLEWAIAAAWALGPSRVWLHTCTLDHPAALPNYLARGFVVTRTEQVSAPVPPGA